MSFHVSSAFEFPGFHNVLRHTKGSSSRTGHALTVASSVPVFGAVDLGWGDAIRRNGLVGLFRFSVTSRSYQSVDTAN